ncbi:hypothetical protein AVEN_270816-1 [Araneus ventricosus]|uniref:Uncharacterized protein n=1 Tax=Araneus ventricosus TaxID=182803 RepID=A0A4Y2JNW8_ARAVE|nr:hypothetical protein AVEN_270816-1 [Araneus ventricosus]
MKTVVSDDAYRNFHQLCSRSSVLCFYSPIGSLVSNPEDLSRFKFLEVFSSRFLLVGSIFWLIHSLWQELWDLEIRNKLHLIKPRINMWSIIPTRVTDVKLTRLRIGHTRFTHKHLLFGESAPECPTFNSHRVTYFNSSPNMKELLGEFPHPRLFDYLKAIGFYSI